MSLGTCCSEPLKDRLLDRGFYSKVAAFVALKPAGHVPAPCAPMAVPNRDLVPCHPLPLASPEQTGSTSGLVVSLCQLS